MVVGRSDSASGERRGSGGAVVEEGGERASADVGDCDVLDGPASVGEAEGEAGVAEPDHHEDQDDEVCGAAGGVLDASAGGCWVGG
jgi:hypothetical protein